MSNAHPLRIVAALFGLVILASCGSSQDTASETTTAPSVTTTQAPSLPQTSFIQPAQNFDSDRTPEEQAIDRLDLMSAQLGIRDLAGVGQCVMDRFEEEGIELTGEGTAELLALTACQPSAIVEWFPSSNPQLDTDQWACTVVNIGDWLNARTIAEGEAFLAADVPPAEFIMMTAEACEIPIEDLEAALA